MWKQEYKGVNIRCNTEGIFEFVFRNGRHTVDTFRCAKQKIDTLTKDYYEITSQCLDNLLDKLDDREADFVLSTLKELMRHNGNAYCEMGISEAYDFTFTEETLRKIDSQLF